MRAMDARGVRARMARSSAMQGGGLPFRPTRSQRSGDREPGGLSYDGSSRALYKNVRPSICLRPQLKIPLGCAVATRAHLSRDHRSQSQVHSSKCTQVIVFWNVLEPFINRITSEHMCL